MLVHYSARRFGRHDNDASHRPFSTVQLSNGGSEEIHDIFAVEAPIFLYHDAARPAS